MTKQTFVFMSLRESARRSDRTVLGMGVVSLGVHTALILGLVFAIRSRHLSSTSVVTDTSVVFLESPRIAPQQLPMQLDVPLKGFQTLAALPEIPTSMPPVDLQEHFDPKDYSGTGVEGGAADGAAPAENRVYAAAGVEEARAACRPHLLTRGVAGPASRATCSGRSWTLPAGSSPAPSGFSRAQLWI
jgi:hypothetical protein